MSFHIGQKIKSLRQSQDVTQEKFAEYLNISARAVSKWENGLSYPDITLIPRIANFFGISADELLGIKQSETGEELAQFEKQYSENSVKGKILENIELSRAVLQKYPRNYQWMLNLSYSLVQYNATNEQIRYSWENNFIEKAISLCERIREDCTVDSIRHGAAQILCFNYPKIGKKEEALKIADEMPEMRICKDFLQSRIYEGEARIKQNQENLLQMIDLCGEILVELSFEKGCNMNLSIKDKIAFIKAANTLYLTVLGSGESLLFYNSRLSWNYRRLAEGYCALGDKKQAMEYLLFAEKSAKLYDECRRKGKQKYASVFVNQCIFDPEDIEKNWEGTETSMLYYRTTEGVFDALRDMEKFKKLQDRLKEASNT